MSDCCKSVCDQYCAEFYDAVPLYQARTDVPFYLEEARAAGARAKPGEAPVLELGCGSGRILSPIAAAGVRITGLDLSPSMLAACRTKIAALPEEIQRRAHVVDGDMTRFRFDETFQLITTPFRAFQHLITVEDQLACLACVHKHLAPGGRLILDMFHVNPAAMFDPVWMEEREDTPTTAISGGRTMRRTVRIATFDRAGQRNEVEFAFYLTHPDGRTERLTERFWIRYFFRYEVEHLLARAGFRIAAVHGNFDRSPFTHDSPEMLVVAEIS